MFPRPEDNQLDNRLKTELNEKKRERGGRVKNQFNTEVNNEEQTQNWFQILG